jgi:protoheme IX farnesyltransferase
MKTEALFETTARPVEMKRSDWLLGVIGVLKPRETSLLVFIGFCSAVVAGGGQPEAGNLGLALAAITLGSAGANGLTNYLDRQVDGRMQRTVRRALPAGLVKPPEKVLPLLLALLIAGLALAWLLHPLAFVAGLVGTIAAVIARKTWATHILGGVSGAAPVAVGWLAIDHSPGLPLLLLSLLIMVWVPIHVWSLMMAYRKDYLKAGVNMFPVTRPVSQAIKVFPVLSAALYGLSIGLWQAADFGWFYFALANVLGLAVFLASLRLLKSGVGWDAWRIYKLSAYPYLGLIFLAMCIDLWL